MRDDRDSRSEDSSPHGNRLRITVLSHARGAAARWRSRAKVARGAYPDNRAAALYRPITTNNDG